MKIKLSKIVFKMTMVSCVLLNQQVTAASKDDGCFTLGSSDIDNYRSSAPAAVSSAPAIAPITVPIIIPPRFSFETYLNLNICVPTADIIKKLQNVSAIEFFLNGQSVGSLTTDSFKVATTTVTINDKIPFTGGVSSEIRLTYTITDCSGQKSTAKPITTMCREQLYNYHGYYRLDGKSPVFHSLGESTPFILGEMNFNHYYAKSIQLSASGASGITIAGYIEDAKLPENKLDEMLIRQWFEKEQRQKMWSLERFVEADTSDAELVAIAKAQATILATIEDFPASDLKSKEQSQLQSLQRWRLQRMTRALIDPVSVEDPSDKTFSQLSGKLQTIPVDGLRAVVNKMLLLKQKMGDESYMVLLRETILPIPVDGLQAYLDNLKYE